MNKKLKVGIFLFNEVEVLDFAGPFEVFSIASKDHEKLFQVETVGETGAMISARGGLKVQPKASFSDATHYDILIIPGGYGAEEIEIRNKVVIEWIREQQLRVQILASVCTGAFLLAKAGLLDHKKVTTHWMDQDRLEREYQTLKVVRNVKFVDEGNIITSGGISAGIHMSFHLIQRLYGTEVARFTAKKMEYDLVFEEK